MVISKPRPLADYYDAVKDYKWLWQTSIENLLNPKFFAEIYLIQNSFEVKILKLKEVLSLN